MIFDFTELRSFLVNAVTKEYMNQGHDLTGSLRASIETRVEELTGRDGIELQLLYFKYGAFLNKGVKPARIPFSGGRGRGGTSAYIEGLKRFVRLRRMTSGLESEVTSVAFAIARTQKREGMPTRGSYRFSFNNRRKGWQDHVIEEEGPTIDALSIEAIDRAIIESFDALIYEFVL